MSNKITIEELKKHNSKTDLWLAVNGKVYNITEFQKQHPGSAAILNRVGGTNATKKFMKYHPSSVLRILKSSEYVGELDEGVSYNNKKYADSEDNKATASTTAAVSSLGTPDPQTRQIEKHKPNLGEIYNLFDFEHVARHNMNRTGWYYYSSGSDDEITMRENHRAYQRIWFRPKVLVDVSEIDFSTTMLGYKANSPFYVTATALGKLGHPEGETCLTRAAAKARIPQMVSTLSSCSIDEIMITAEREQSIWMQVYVNSNREMTRKFIEHAEKLGVSGFFITVDAPQLGRREKDMRSKYDTELANVQENDAEADRNQGAARAISGFIDPGLSWKDVPFLLSCTTKPVFIKGVQRWEDAVMAASMGFAGCVLSNHGGRQLEFSRSAIEILAETMPKLRSKSLDRKFDVFVDGGVRRGTDVLKALCLGAKAVGIGRPFLYAMSTYGTPGVIKAIGLLNEEIEMNMRLLGVTNLRQLGPELIDARSLSAHNTTPPDYAFEQVYERSQQPLFKHRM